MSPTIFKRRPRALERFENRRPSITIHLPAGKQRKTKNATATNLADTARICLESPRLAPECTILCLCPVCSSCVEPADCYRHKRDVVASQPAFPFSVLEMVCQPGRHVFFFNPLLDSENWSLILHSPLAAAALRLSSSVAHFSMLECGRWEVNGCVNVCRWVQAGEYAE